jgi:hypothetical protein
MYMFPMYNGVILHICCAGDACHDCKYHDCKHNALRKVSCGHVVT